MGPVPSGGYAQWLGELRLHHRPCPPDIEPIHDRTPPVLTLEQGMEWLRLDGPGKAPFYDLPPLGTYSVKVSPLDRIMSAEMRRLL